MSNKKQRGQFFTVDERLLDLVVSLAGDNPGLTLEPSSGSGDIMRAMKKAHPDLPIFGWELDASVVPQDDEIDVTVGDFFYLAEFESRKFKTIVGNPPFVAWKNVEDNTKVSAKPIKDAYGDKVNLYLLFIDRCIDLLEDFGQLVFIVPKEWLYLTSAEPLRQKMLKYGTLSHMVDIGEEKVFPDADIPALMVFRFEKTPSRSHKVLTKTGLDEKTPWISKQLTVSHNGLWLVLDDSNNTSGTTISDFFDVKVGIVSGADKVFNVTHHESLAIFEKEGTVRTFLTTKGHEFFIDVTDIQEESKIPESTLNYLLQFKKELANRKISKFNENNWWKFGAVRNKSLMESDRPRIYVHAKTRNQEPFFIDDEVTYFSGGVICLFLKEEFKNTVKTDEVVNHLNSSDFRSLCEALGITTNNKVSFQPSTLGEIPFSL